MNVSYTYDDLARMIRAGESYPPGHKGKLTKVERSRLNYHISNKNPEEWKNIRFEIHSKFILSDLQSESFTFNERDGGKASTKGLRKEMEDADLTGHFQVKGHTAEIYAVFDGHSGADAALFLKKYLLGEVQEGLEKCLTKDEIWDLFKCTLPRLNERYQGSAGSTATIALIFKGFLWIAHLGDSIALLSNGKTWERLSENAFPDKERYGRKVERDGGEIVRRYVNSDTLSYANARAFGDKGVKGISAVPKIIFFPLSSIKEGSLLLLASDGLMEKASEKQVSEAIGELKEESAAEISKHLVESAVRSGSRDNISVIVVKL